MPPFHRRGKNLTRTMDQAMDKEAIRGRALDLGSDAVGFVRADDPGFDVLPNRLGPFEVRIPRRHGLDGQTPGPPGASGTLPDANSIVVLGKTMVPTGIRRKAGPDRTKERSVVTQGADYHDPIKND